MSLYTERLTKEEAIARLEAALAKMPPRLAAHFRRCVDFGEAPGEGALWLRQHVSGSDGATIGALQDASLALLGYHNTLVAEEAQARLDEERKIWMRCVLDRDGIPSDHRAALAGLGIDVDALAEAVS